jgi:hypothetical protein
VLLGWICYSTVEALATVRWQILLRIQDIRLRWLQAGGIVMIGLFFNQFLPTADIFDAAHRPGCCHMAADGLHPIDVCTEILSSELAIYNSASIRV